MALRDHIDLKQLWLAAVPAVVYVALIVWCARSPSPGAWPTFAFAAIMLPSYALLAWLAYDRAWGGAWGASDGLRAKDGIWPRSSRLTFFASWPGLAFVAATVAVAHAHWYLIESAKIALEPEEIMPGVRPFEEVPSGLDVFAPMLGPMGVVFPLCIVAILWFFLPSKA